MMYQTYDGGFSWNQIHTQSNDLNGITLADTLNGWAVGDGGAIISTTDGGKTGAMQNSGTSCFLLNVYFVDTLTGWAVGGGGLILYTKDGGETWPSQLSGTTEKLNDVYFTDPTTGWIGGNYGTILKIRRAGKIQSISARDAILQRYSLRQNYPNPFNSATTILYRVPESCNVVIHIYNILGQEIKTLFRGIRAHGDDEVQWEDTNDVGKPVSTGIYLYRMETNKGFVRTKKLVYFK